MVFGHGKNENTETVPYRLQRVEEMSQKCWRAGRTLRRNSRSFSSRPSLSWFATQNWLDRAENASKWIKLAQADHSYRLSRKEFERYQGQWYLTLNKSGKNAPMRLRSDFRAAVTIKNRLHRESGEERAEPIPFQQHQRWHPSSSNDSWWKLGPRPKAGGAHEFESFFQLFVAVGFVYSW